MKVFGAVLVIIASCGIGCLYADEIKRRKHELEEQYVLMRLILGDVRYMRATLSEAVNRAIKRHKGSYLEFLNEVAESLAEAPGISLSDIWERAVTNGLRCSALKTEDKQKMISFGESICSSECEIVISCFEEYICELKNRISELQDCMSAKGKLYRSLGLLTGLFIVVLFL